MVALQPPLENRLLAVLPPLESERLLDYLELIHMPFGEVVYESGSKQDYVYFPTTAIVSLLYVTEDGSSSEIAIVVNEGMVGVVLFMGGETTPSRAVARVRCSRPATTSTLIAAVTRHRFTRVCSKCWQEMRVSKTSNCAVLGCFNNGRHYLPANAAHAAPGVGSAPV